MIIIENKSRVTDAEAMIISSKFVNDAEAHGEGYADAFRCVVGRVNLLVKLEHLKNSISIIVYNDNRKLGG